MGHVFTRKSVSPDYYQEVLHGYLIQERVCRAYSVLLLGCKFVALTALIIPVIIWIFDLFTGQSLTLGIVGFFGFISIIALDLCEKKYGKPVWRHSRAAGLGNWEFESKYSHPDLRR